MPSAFKQLFHAVKHHFPKLCVLLLLFFRGVIVLGNSKLGTAVFNSKFVTYLMIVLRGIG